MTMRQLHYTSCQHGLEGIEGFQISAATPGVPKAMVDLAVRASAYEAGPALVRHMTDEDLSGFPVAFGYATSGESGVVFQSSYVGRDFTGRPGNYFAHAVLVDDVKREFTGLLPVDLWESPVWTASGMAGVTELAELDRFTPGPATGPQATARFLAEPDRIERLARLVSAVQPLLAQRRDRLILVVEQPRDSAPWLAALTRSLPRRLSLRVSFVTYTARPEEQQVLISCVTPDVRVSAYGGFTVLDLATADSDEVTAYARMFAQAWRDGTAPQAVALAESVRPELSETELDTFATMAALCLRQPIESTVDEQELVSAIMFAEQRLPSGLPADGWRQAAAVVMSSGIHSAAVWEPVVRSAWDSQRPIPPELLGTYYAATLAAEGPVWVPLLDSAQLNDIAVRVVVPALTAPERVLALGRLMDRQDLMDAVAREVDQRLAISGTTEMAIALRPEAMEALAAQGHRYPHLHRMVEIARARHGNQDRVDVLAKVSREPGEWHELGRALWPDLPSAEDGVRAVQSVSAPALGRTGLTERFVERILQSAEDGNLSTSDVQLAEALLDSHCMQDIPAGGQTALHAVRTGAILRTSSGKNVTPGQLTEALGLLRSVAPGIGRHVLDGVVMFLLRVDDPTRHKELLMVSVQAEPRRVLAVYREAALGRLKTMSPHRVALLAVTWAAVDAKDVRHQLVEEVLAEGVAGRRKGELDKIADVLRRMPARDNLAKAAGIRGGDWAKWWQDWRSRHERRGLLSRLLAPRKR